MKWFQVDSDTPNDPKIRHLIREMGNAGLGALLRLWCFIADHGKGPIGWGVDADGQPFSEAQLRNATGLKRVGFANLTRIILESKHIDSRMWLEKGIIVIPAMSKRADTYNRRHPGTTAEMFEHASKLPPLQDNTITIQSTKRSTAAPKLAADEPPQSGGLRPLFPDPKPAQTNSYRVVLKLAYGAIGRVPIEHQLDYASIKEETKQACARYGITYDAEVVGKALDSALAARAKMRTRLGS